MLTWSTRSALFLAPCALALGGSLFPASSADAQVSAANTIAPANTVVEQPLPTLKPSVASVRATARKASSSTTAKAKKPRLVRSSPTALSVPPSTISVAPPAGSDPVTTGTIASLGAPTIADPSAAVAPAEAVSFSDPLADLASAALLVIPAGQAGVATATGPVPPPAVVVTATAAAPAVQFAVTPPIPDPNLDPNAPRPPSSIGSSSFTISTADLAEYVLGTAIVAPVSKESQAVLAALPTVGSDRYVALLRAMAKVVGPRTKTDPAALEAVWSRTDSRRMKAILTAMAQVGTRYFYTGNKPGGFDCSGLTSYAWSQAGVKIPRTSSQQFEGLPRKVAGDLLPGDIVWHPGHVSMYLGVDQAVVDAPQTGKTVEVKKAGASSFVGFVSPY